jgi:hypothetical protein
MTEKISDKAFDKLKKEMKPDITDTKKENLKNVEVYF